MIRYHDSGTSAPSYPPPGCTCHKPLGLVIRPGTHVHICPVHPGVAVYGQNFTC